MTNEEKIKEVKKRLDELNVPQFFANNRDMEGKSVDQLVEEAETEYKEVNDSAGHDEFNDELQKWERRK